MKEVTFLCESKGFNMKMLDTHKILILKCLAVEKLLTFSRNFKRFLKSSHSHFNFLAYFSNFRVQN